MPRWFIWTLIAIFCWGIWAVLSKAVALNATQVQIYSTAGMVPVIALLAFSSKVRAEKHLTVGIILAFVAGLLACFGNFAYYTILEMEKASAAVPLTALYPLVTILLAVLFLRERLNFIQILGVALSLAAIYFFNIQKEPGYFLQWLAPILLPMFFWGVAGFAQKLATFKVSGEVATLYFLLAFVPFVPFIAFVFPMGTAPSLVAGLTAKNLMLMILQGLALALGNWACLLAFAYGGKASIITPITALYPIISIPIAILGFGERPSLRESIGIILALVAVVAISIESKAPIPESSTP